MRQLLAQNMRLLRAESGKSMAALCESVGMSRAFWTELEKGLRDPSISTLENIAQAFDITVNDLLTERKSSNGKRRKELTGERKSS